MPTTISSIVLVFAIMLSSHSFGQSHRMYELEKELMQGKKSALYELAAYFDSQKVISEYLGFHHLRPTESDVAERMVEENCMFLPEEFDFSGDILKKDFLRFLQDNDDKIFFSELAGAFVITPFKNRRAESDSSRIELTGLSEKRKNDLLAKKFALMNLPWVTGHQIDVLIRQKDPEALLQIASLLLRGRNRFNRYQWNGEEYIDLLELLTQTSIAVPNAKGKLSRQIAKDFDPESKKNLLIYIAGNYSNYLWDDEKSAFVLPSAAVRPPSPERALFELLGNKDNEIALAAFIELSHGDPATVVKIAGEYQDARIDHNRSILPTFPYKFLMQLAPMTAYFREKGIDYRGSLEFQYKIEMLRPWSLDFKERYRLENELIDSLSLEDITALEYWTIIYGGGYQSSLSYSAGRILDVFYSRHWKEMISSPLYLETYLRKAEWFDQLGIIGSCNNYLGKFAFASEETLQAISALQTSDLLIQKQVLRIQELNQNRSPKRKTGQKQWDGNRDFPPIPDLEKKLKKLTGSSRKREDIEESLEEILAGITYEQIGIAMQGIEQFEFEQAWQKYSFLERDWGFFNYYFKDAADREDFLEQYNSLTEYELYAGMLDDAGIDYQKADGSLDYDKVYEMLKYDVVVAFIGGGGGKRDRQVYSLIKLLELNFETTLGYPRKFCNSANMYGCSSDDRAGDWMNYLEENKLLELPHDEPVSFSLELE